MKNGIYLYIKRLGQQHLAEPGQSTTLCGQPMLGNNYAREALQPHIVGDIKRCEKCYAILDKIEPEPVKKMPDAWAEMQDLYAFAQWGLQNDKSASYILSNILHDLKGLCENDPCFAPRTEGYKDLMQKQGGAA